MLGIFIGALSFNSMLRKWREPARFDQVRFQVLSSEIMQQTLSVVDLRDNMASSLYYLHIQPPAFDFLRAVIAKTYSFFQPAGSDLELVQSVDSSLYSVNAVIFGSIAALSFYWLWRMTSPGLALVATVLLLLHPGMIYYSTFLDGTFLSSAFFLLYFVVLWRCLAGHGSPSLLAVCTLLLFFTRSIFQWPFVLVTAVSLVVGGLPWPAVRRFLVVAVPIVVLFMVKQYLLFGLTVSTSFAGLSLSHTVDLFPQYEANPRLLNPQYDSLNLPPALKRRKKVNGAVNLNHISFLQYNRELLASATAKLWTEDAFVQLNRYWQSMCCYFLPSSRYSAHTIVDVLPWRGWYDFIFSAERLVMLLLFALFLWFAASRGQDRCRGVAMALPMLFVFAISILFDRGENMRFKWFVEPVLFIFLVTRFHALWACCRPPVLPGKRVPSLELSGDIPLSIC